MKNDLIIHNVLVKKDENGLFCLNDLWKAAGGNEKDKPSRWDRTDKAQEFINYQANLKSHICPFRKSSGRYGGTYANKAIVIDYAMWISPEFKNHVIKVFDDYVVNSVKQTTETSVALIRHNVNSIMDTLNDASVSLDEIKQCGKSWGSAGASIRAAKKEAISELEKAKDEIQYKLDFIEGK